MVGKPETADVVDQTRQNAKLWYRIDADCAPPAGKERYEAVMAQANRVLFPGMAHLLNRPDQDGCPNCRRRLSYGAEAAGRFGGVELCDACRSQWHTCLHTFPDRFAQALAPSP